MIKFYYGNQKKDKKAKQQYNKLMQIDTNTRDSLIHDYIEKCKLEFTVNYFEFKIANDSKFNPEIAENLN